MKRKPAQEGRIKRVLHVGCQNGQPAIRLHSLQKVADLDVGITIVAVFHLAPFAEERVGFVEKQDRATFLGGVEHAAQIFLRLADVLAHNRAEIDPEKIEPQFVRQNFRREGFTRAARPGEECAQTEPAIGLLGETPVVVDPRPLPQMLGDRLQGVQLGRGQDDVGPAGVGSDALREILQARPRLQATGIPKSRLRVFACQSGGGRPDRGGAEIELRNETIEMPIPSVRSFPDRLFPRSTLFSSASVSEPRP